MIKQHELTMKQVFPFLVADLKCGNTPALLGEPGIGKTTLIQNLASVFKTKVFVLPVNQLADRADLTGVRLVDEHNNGKWRQKAYPNAIIMNAIEYAEEHPDENPILFMDEFNRTTSDVTSAILSFQTLRSVGDVKFPKNLRMVVAGNDKGNVTSLDSASISRFSIYRIKPDLDTFISVQALNPFVLDVLNNYPEDLMAEEAVFATNVVQKTDDDDGDDNERDVFSQLEEMGEGNFNQITRPRTISYTSEWLNELDITRSGSDKERENLSAFLTDVVHETDSIFLPAIQAHVGSTTFAFHLYQEINKYFNTLISSNHTSNAPLLSKFKPDQDVINKLHRASNESEIEQLILSLDENARATFLLWLTEQVNVTEVNNNSAVNSYMTNAPHHIANLDKNLALELIKMCDTPERLSKTAMQSLLGSSAPMLDKWKTSINALMEN